MTGRETTCPRCGSTETTRKMRETICGGCSVVLDYHNTQPVVVMDLPDRVSEQEPETDDAGFVLDEHGNPFGTCNSCGEEAPAYTECCADGEVVPYPGDGVTE